MPELPPDRLNAPAPHALDLLLSRRSGSAKRMTAPGPSEMELRNILEAGARVPDHGKLAPWRFVLLEGPARAAFGDVLAAALQANEPDASPERLQVERQRFLRAPVEIAVVSRVKPGIPIPEWEQILSVGAACQNMLLAAHAQGYVANWITEWCAYDKSVQAALGLGDNERIAGFIYVGMTAEPLVERVRPDLDALITRWTSPAAA